MIFQRLIIASLADNNDTEILRRVRLVSFTRGRKRRRRNRLLALERKDNRLISSTKVKEFVGRRAERSTGKKNSAMEETREVENGGLMVELDIGPVISDIFTI